MATANPRWIALQIILQVFNRGHSLDDVFAGKWYQALAADPRDLALSRELAYGLCRWYFALSPLLATRLKKPLRGRDFDVEIILLLGVYQLLIMQTEAHAAVNETVELAKRQKKNWAVGLINAVLRGLIREAVKLDDSAQAGAYPNWMRAKIAGDWGTAAEPLLIAGNSRAPMTLRVDTGQISRAEYLKQLSAESIAATAHPIVDSAIELAQPCDVAQLLGFAEGRVSVQDAAAQLAAELLQCQPGMRLLDACAAPGGKTAHLLQRYAEIELDVLDISETRLERVRQNLARIDKSARLLVGDASETRAWFDGKPYDAILVDLPCSASGVIRRHPDIKLLRRESDIMPLLERQREIMDACWRVLKPGGNMLYCTCSIFKDENENQISNFLKRQPDCSEADLSQECWGMPQAHGRQILTGIENMDGFYYALLSKKGDQ